MSNSVLGLHHVTAISSDPQRTIDFYTGVLGLRLVKLTVNFDDPGTYHLYFGDEVGRPGTILTFFPWPGQPLGEKGTGQTAAISFSIPNDGMDYWRERLRSQGVSTREAGERFREPVLSFADHDGQDLELVGSKKGHMSPGWTEGPVPADYAITGFHSVTLSEQSLVQTEPVLVTLGLRPVGHESDRYRYQVGTEGHGSIVDILSEPSRQRGFVSVGTVHHVAFRAKDDDDQKQLREEILKANLHATTVIDRVYFRSIYFREPGGVLLEVATDLPGFGIDEDADKLGTGLRLPPWLEASRKDIERNLPPIRQLKTIAA